MNRLLHTALLFFTLSTAAYSQQFDVCMDVVASSGGQGNQANRYFSWTVGEPFIQTSQGAGFTFTQGFHQPDPCGKDFVSTTDLADWGMSLFPNPTAGLVTIRFSPEKKGYLVATVFDLLGRTVLDQQVLDTPEGSFLDATQWQPGVYFIRLQEPVSKASTILRVVRI